MVRDPRNGSETWPAAGLVTGPCRTGNGRLTIARIDARRIETVSFDRAAEDANVDRETGEKRHAQVFVAVLGASNYTYAEATWTQTLPDWTASHVCAFGFFGGCPELVIPDDLRSAVSRAHRYEPDINPTFHELAHHYGVAVLPARARRPRDKSHTSYCAPLLRAKWVFRNAGISGGISSAGRRRAAEHRGRGACRRRQSLEGIPCSAIL